MSDSNNQKVTDTDNLELSASETVAEPTEAPTAADPLAQLQQKIEQLTAELAQERDLRLRTLADYDNFRKRSRSDWQRLVALAGERIILQLLPVLDDMVRVVQQTAAETETNPVRMAVEMAHRKLLTILQAEGLTAIEALGMPFNPEWHEAVSETDDPQQPDGIVAMEIDKGYKLGGKVLRHSRVVVNHHPQEQTRGEDG